MPNEKSQISFAVGQVKAPCKDCSERFVGCHTVCFEYAEYKQALEAEKERYRASKANEDSFFEYEKDRKRRLKKYYKTKGSRKNERT